MSVYVSIGRNIGSTPMNDNDWLAFRNETARVVAELCGPLVSETRGDGYYDGRSEQTAIIVGADTRSYTDNYAALRETLATLAKLYGQESIALTIGEAEFVKGR